MSELGLGTWAFGGHNWSHGWGPQDDAESKEVLLNGFDRGVRFVDTAPAYGLGRSERVIGEVLDLCSQGEYHILTKCGQEPREDGRGFSINLEPSYIRGEIEGSLSRLGVRLIDLLFIHYPAGSDDLNYLALEELCRFRERGVLGGIGLSNFSASQVSKCAARFKIDAIQSRYSIINRSIEDDIKEFCRKGNIKIFGYQPLESGLLTGHITGTVKKRFSDGDWRYRSSDFGISNVLKIQPLLDKLIEVSNRLETSVAGTTLAWTLKNTPCDVTLVGARNLSQLDQLFDYQRVNFTQEDLDEIESIVYKIRSRETNL